MEAAFDKSWIGSIPRAKLEELRFAHRVSFLFLIQTAPHSPPLPANHHQRVRGDQSHAPEARSRSRQVSPRPSSLCLSLTPLRNENALSSSLDDETAAEDAKEAHEADHRRISSAYDGAEELLHRILNSGASDDYECPTEDSLDQPGASSESKEAAVGEEAPQSASPASPIPAYQPPARRTSRIMMSILTEDLPPPSPLLTSPSPPPALDPSSS
jgi:hypothetical protein